MYNSGIYINMEVDMKNKNNTVKRDVKKLIIPTISGMLVTFLFQLVDTYFIGKLGSSELAAIGFTYPIYIGMISIFMGLAVGTSASVGKVFGQNNKDRVKELTSTSIIMSLIVSIGFLGILFGFRHSVYEMLGATQEIFGKIDAYMVIIILGMPLLAMTLNAISGLRATGNALFPELVMGFGGIINIVLDYLLIFGYGSLKPMGIQGAALATVISWGLVFIVISMILIKNKMITFNIKIKQMISASNDIIKIALPAVGVQLITPISMGFITYFVAKQGDLSVAAFGIATKIESLSLTIVLALSIVIVPLAAKHYGAKEQNHFDYLVALAGKISSYWSVLVYIIIIFTSKMIAGIFTTSPEIIDMVSNYLLIVGLFYPFLGLTLVTNSLFNAVEEPKKSLTITLIKYIVVLMPAVIIGSQFGVIGIWIALGLTHLFGGLLARRFFFKWLSKVGSKVGSVKLIDEYTSDFKKIWNRWFKHSID